MTATAGAATPWWEQQTVCRLNPASCYTSMLGAGYDSGMWDANAGCWGMKLICGDALTNTNDTTPVGKTEIARGTNISTDYDINILDGDCFGVRKTSIDGSMALNQHAEHWPTMVMLLLQMVNAMEDIMTQLVITYNVLVKPRH